MTKATIEVRRARLEDSKTIAEFNSRLAWETEETRLDRQTIHAGVVSLLEDPRKGRYFVACVEDAVIGQIMHTWEWSDWRNGEIWWLQSVYVLPEFRKRGVFRQLYQHVLDEAEQDPQVVGIRLYVESENQPAQGTYNRLGMNDTGYIVFERLLAN